MKKFLSYLAGSLLLVSMFLSTGCQDDPIVDPVKDAPLLTIGSSSDVVDGGTAPTLTGQGTVFIQLIASQGTDPLESITFREDGNKLELSRLDVVGKTPGDAAILLLNNDKTGFTWDVTITSPANAGTYDYSIVLADEGGLTDNVTFTIVVEDPIVTTPIDSTLTGVLFNAESPTNGTGSLDLDEGKSSGITTSGQTTPDQAEIRDMGLDCTVPAPGLNWRRQIGAFNGTTMRQVDVSQLENFTFDNVSIKEDIVNAYDTGFSLSPSDVINCGTGAVKATVDHVSEELAIGDMFVVYNGTRYYLIRVDEINETNNNNQDSYMFSVKY